MPLPQGLLSRGAALRAAVATQLVLQPSLAAGCVELVLWGIAVVVSLSLRMTTEHAQQVAMTQELATRL